MRRNLPAVGKARGSDRKLTTAFRDRLRGAREAAGLSCQDLADLVGCTKGTISNIERGHTKAVHEHTLERICQVLRVAPPEIEINSELVAEVIKAFNTIESADAEEAAEWASILKIAAKRMARRPR
jgi:transcriptional regulator with XRE-family HTH domain